MGSIRSLGSNSWPITKDVLQRMSRTLFTESPLYQFLRRTLGGLQHHRLHQSHDGEATRAIFDIIKQQPGYT